MSSTIVCLPSPPSPAFLFQPLMFPLSLNLFSKDVALELSSPSTFSVICYCIFFFIVSLFFKKSSEALDPQSSEEFPAPCSSCISFFTRCHAALCDVNSVQEPVCHFVTLLLCAPLTPFCQAHQYFYS